MESIVYEELFGYRRRRQFVKENEKQINIRFENWDRYPTPVLGKDSCLYLLVGWHLYFDHNVDSEAGETLSKNSGISFAKEANECITSWFSIENYDKPSVPSYEDWLDELYEKEIIWSESEGSFCQDYALWLFDLKYNKQPRCEVNHIVCYQNNCVW